jgi:hypothetical protein
VIDAFPFKKLTQEKAQREINRIARKCLKRAIGHPGLEVYDATTCDVREEVIEGSQLPELVRYHKRTKLTGRSTPIVIVEVEERRVVIEGNNRVNAWVDAGDTTPRQALVITPRSPLVLNEP